LVQHENLDANLQAGPGRTSYPMVQLLGGSASGPLGNCLTARKVIMNVVGFLGVPTAGWRSAPAYSPVREYSGKY